MGAPLELTIRSFEHSVLINKEEQRNYCTIHGSRVLIGYHSHTMDYGETEIGRLLKTGAGEFLQLQDANEREKEIIDLVLPQVLKCLKGEHKIIGIIRDSETPKRRN